MLPSDIDDARYAHLVAFCIEYALPLKEASLPVSEPEQFLAESWKVLGIAACDTQRVFYLSYDELLLACALRRENVMDWDKNMHTYYHNKVDSLERIITCPRPLAKP